MQLFPLLLWFYRYQYLLINAAAALICNIYFNQRVHLHMQLMRGSNFMENQFRN